MRNLFLLGTLLVLLAAGCNNEPYSEPTVDAFVGQLTHDGKPVSFTDAKKVTLQLVFHKNGERFGVPIQPDGTFKIGWMPIGEYSASLEVEKQPKDGKTPPPARHSLPDKFVIEEGKTEYQVELGKGFKP